MPSRWAGWRHGGEEHRSGGHGVVGPDARGSEPWCRAVGAGECARDERRLVGTGGQYPGVRWADSVSQSVVWGADAVRVGRFAA
jgi:hypothetical protein